MKRIISLICCLAILAATGTVALAHSGRTDSAGGHRDNKNASGLGYYHYHHGYGPHLHTGGVCPYAGGTASTGSASSGTTGTASTATAPAQTAPSLTEAEEAIVSEARRQLVSGVRTLKLSNYTSCRAECLREIGRAAKGYSGDFQVCMDVKQDNAVLCRYTFTPDENSGSLAFGFETGTEETNRIAGLFKGWFGADVAVFKFEQADFGMAMRIAVKDSLGSLDRQNLCFYTYDATANTYVALSDTGYRCDDAGYLHFTTTRGGFIVVSSGPLGA